MKKILLSLSLVLVFSGLLPSKSFGQDSYTDNVVVVLDASGSMDSVMKDSKNEVKKMDAAKSALWQVMKNLPKTTNVGVVVFSAKNLSEGSVWVYPLGAKDDDKLKAAIDKPVPGDNTPLASYIKMAADRLLEARSKQHDYGTYRLLVVTDGEANDELPSVVSLLEKWKEEHSKDKGLDNVSLVVKDVLSRGLRVDVIGVAMSSTHTLATKVHSYRSANSPEQLLKAVREVFAESLSKGGDATEDQKMYDEVGGLANEVGLAMTVAATKMPNHPILEAAPAGPAKEVEKTSDAEQKKVAENKKADESNIGCWIAGFIVLIVVVVIAAVVITRDDW